LISFGQNGTVPDPQDSESAARHYDDTSARYTDDWLRNSSTGPTWGYKNDVPPVDSTPTLLLNEIMFFPNMPSDGFVELYLTEGTLDISGYKLVGDSEYTIPPGTILTPEEPYFYLTYNDDWNFFDALESSGDNIYLYNDTGYLLDMAGWSSLHDQGKTMSRVPNGNGTYDGFNDTSSEAAGWVFGCEPTIQMIKITTRDPIKFGYFNCTLNYTLNFENKQSVDDTILIFNSTINGYLVKIYNETGTSVITKISVPAGSSVNITVMVFLPSIIPYIQWDNITVTIQSENNSMYRDEILLQALLPRLIVDAGANQTVSEGETVQFNASGYYDPDWHRLDVNFATDSALYLRQSDPSGPGGGSWEGAVREWVTFTSPDPFWIGKKAGHMGQGPTGYEYTYYWRMHETGVFNLSFRAANGEFYADVYDETDATYIISGLYLQSSNDPTLVIQQLYKDHLYRLDIYDTVSQNLIYPNDLDVIFQIVETDILLTPDKDGLAFYVNPDPLSLAFEGPGVTEVTFYSRGEQVFYVFYFTELNHSEVEISDGELMEANPPYDTGITPGEYSDNIVVPNLNYSWDFDANVDSDGDGNYTNDADAYGRTPTHTYGDNGVYNVTLNVSDIYSLWEIDTCNITVLNEPPTIVPFGPYITEAGILLSIDTTATDPGSDDLIFTWKFEMGPTFVNTYYNNGLGPDPYPSPNGTFPFSVIDSVQHTYLDYGVYSLNLTVEDDDGGIAFYNTTISVITIAPPELFINVSSDGQDVILYWDPLPILGADHYLIYRSTSQVDFDFTTPWVNTSSDNETGEPGPIPLRTMWNDTKAALIGHNNYEEQYYYVIRAVNVFGTVSQTSRTVGKWTKRFLQGISTFSLPLEPIDTLYTDDLTTDMNADYIKYIDPTTRTWIRHNYLDGPTNNVEMKQGEGFEVQFSSQTTYTFRGMPGAMILYDNETGFLGFDFALEAKSLKAVVENDGDVNLSWKEPASMEPGGWYEIYYSNERDGFFKTIDVDYHLACSAIPSGTNITTITGIGADTPGTRLYYIVIPYNSSGIKGSSTYSVGIWNEEYLSQYDTMGIPLKMEVNHTADWYCDEIIDAVGINYFNYTLQLWFWHSTRMPKGAFDCLLLMTEGYQISTASATRFIFIGV
ncbi:MAG: hypothetical protein JSV56_10400, partial [Methanomassiliicoccales archaeon]